MSVKRVDRRSGQVYTERALAPTKRYTSGPSWVHETPFLPLGWEECSAKGAPTLKHSAMRQTLSDQRALTTSLFDSIPWPIASYLWDCLGRSHKRTFYMWKVFASAYPAEFGRLIPYRSMKIEGPRLAMCEYLTMVRSEALHWRTVLTLCTSFASVPDLVDIASIPNLVALEVMTPPQGRRGLDEVDTPVTALSDRIFRTWNEMAQTTGAFSHLRVLRLINQTELSGAMLRSVADFPSLHFVIVYNCPGVRSIGEDGVAAAEDGWEVVGNATEMLASFYTCYQAILEGDLERSTSLMLEDRPVLDFQIGEAKSRMQADSKLVIFQRIEPEPARKKVKAVSSRPAVKRAVMKNRGTKDLKDVLGTFL
ncbi:hypothetical protein FE257_001139 [Aspergillus nanangensis]|uniref:Uncharacterized protein n=1 Tax=Aspergillus nanangensis TaxID=2582783 RepID=A0AAD4GX91_ASPNN|nr:hypothetical protein FE257_001139 [Aspergillus nanangensis]